MTVDAVGTTVGILIKRPDNIFSNGCIQQVLFLAKIIQNAGHTVRFLSVEQGYDKFELTEQSIEFTHERTDFSRYKCVILGSLVLLEANNKAYIDNLVSFDIPIYNLICGNVFVLLQEEFVFDVHHIMHHYMQSYITENWVMEMYDYSLDYIALLTGKPTRVVPYVWDPDVVRTYISKNNLFAGTNDPADSSKVNLLLFEPNMSIHKNALVPILIANEYHRRNPGRLNKVYVFCGDKVLPKMNKTVLNSLEIVKDSKLEMYGRIIMPYIVDNIERHNRFLNVVVSYNLLNKLNFLHLELFDMGVPIVHNCEPYKENGLYFDDFDISKAVELIATARDSFDRVAYKSKCLPILNRFASDNSERIGRYQELLSTIPTRPVLSTATPVVVATNSSDNRAFHPDTPVAAVTTHSGTPARSTTRFVQGEGYAIEVSNQSDIARLEEALVAVTKHPKKTQRHCEVFVAPAVMESQVQKIIDAFTHRMNVRLIAYDRSTPIQEASSFKKTHVIQLQGEKALMSNIKVYTK